jgi:hypothetical protein
MLLGIPFLALAALLIAAAVLPEAQHATLYRVEVESAKLAGLIGCAAAMLRFSRGDYMRTAWLLLGQCYLLIMCNDLLFRAGVGIFSQYSWTPIAEGILVMVANSGLLVGTWMIGRALRVAGFELAGSPMVRIAVQAGAVVLALLAGSYLGFCGARDVYHGQMTGLVDLFSTLADIISFVLIAPFLLTAIALRGGSLAWTWGFLTASLFGWLLFDATLSFGPFLLSSPASSLKVSECFRLLACTFGMTAGLAQRLAVRGLPASATQTPSAAVA